MYHKGKTFEFLLGSSCKVVILTKNDLGLIIFMSSWCLPFQGRKMPEILLRVKPFPSLALVPASKHNLSTI